MLGSSMQYISQRPSCLLSLDWAPVIGVRRRARRRGRAGRAKRIRASVSFSHVGLHHVKPAEKLEANLALELLALVNRQMSLKSAAVLESLGAVRTLEQVGRRVAARLHFTCLTG